METWRELYNTSENSSGSDDGDDSGNSSNSNDDNDDPSASGRMVERLADKGLHETQTQIPRESGKRNGGNGLAPKHVRSRRGKVRTGEQTRVVGEMGANTTTQTVFHCDGRINGPKTIKAFGGAINGKSA